MKNKIMLLLTAVGLAAGIGLASPAQAAPAQPVLPPLDTSAKPVGYTALNALPGTRTAGATANALVTCPCYDYAGGTQNVTYDGVGVNLTIHKPPIFAADYHSLANLTVQSADQKQVIQFGWVVEPTRFGDSEPHLFVFHYVNGNPTCYNGCGWIPAAGAPIHVGDALTSVIGTAKAFAIQYISGSWWLAYGGAWIGAFPGTLWSGATPPATFTQGGRVQAYGEVVATSATSCSDMGNGIMASYPTPDAGARINGYTLVGGNAPAVFSTFATTPARWGVAAAGTLGIGLRYGGPGYC